MCSALSLSLSYHIPYTPLWGWHLSMILMRWAIGTMNLSKSFRAGEIFSDWRCQKETCINQHNTGDTFINCTWAHRDHQEAAWTWTFWTWTPLILNVILINQNKKCSVIYSHRSLVSFSDISVFSKKGQMIQLYTTYTASNRRQTKLAVSCCTQWNIKLCLYCMAA